MLLRLPKPCVAGTNPAGGTGRAKGNGKRRRDDNGEPETPALRANLSARRRPQATIFMMNTTWKSAVLVILTFLCVAVTGGGRGLWAAPPDATTDKPVTLREFLVLPAVGHYGRLPLQRDAVEAQIVTGTWQIPAEGAQIDNGDGGHEAWQTATTAADGTLDVGRLRGGYAYATYDSPTEQVMLFEATGHAAVYVNGQPHTGDPYGWGWLRLPVLLERGRNSFLFHLAGDRFSARLVPPPAPCSSSTTITRCPRWCAARRRPCGPRCRWSMRRAIGSKERRSSAAARRATASHGRGTDPAAVGPQGRIPDPPRRRMPRATS